MRVMIIKRLISTNVKQGSLPNTKMFSLTYSYHERRETKITIKKVKSYFSHLPMNQNISDISLTTKKGTHCLSIIYENHIF